MEQVIAEVFVRYPQIGLPIVKGSRNSDAFKNAVALGLPVQEPVENFVGDARDSFTSVQTPGGEAAILYLYRREDFENAVRCLSAFCEPIDIPASMGAQTIGGLINWKKINDHKQAYLAGGGFLWGEELKRFTAVRENYRDHLIILSSGPYSAVSAEDAGRTLGMPITEADWCAKSVVIRKYHELTHFIARKLYPEHKEAIRDEIIADAMGLVAAFGSYDPGLAKLFLGLENDTYREGGRLQNYYGEEDAAVVQARARRLIGILAALLDQVCSAQPEDIFPLVCRIEQEQLGITQAAE